MSTSANHGFPRVSPEPLLGAALLGAVLLMAACGDLTGPDDGGPGVTPPPTDTATGLPSTNVHRSDLEPAGTVVETADGYTVSGSLTMSTSDTTTITFLEANVRVRFDENDRVTSISGRVRIPSPHPRIRFHDPVQADVGFFRGSYLNKERDLGILLRDDVDYFLYNYQSAIAMDIATGDTGHEAVRPVRIGVSGGSLMIVDYADPMYYVYGYVDGLADMGFGWSNNGRIPFVPDHPVAGLGSFEGRSIRTGTFPVFKVFSITGETVDNNKTEVHLTEEEPFVAVDLPKDFQQGWNGTFDLDLSIKDFGGLAIPVAEGSGGVFAGARDSNAFRGHVYGNGKASEDRSWWPAYLPYEPNHDLTVEAYATDEGRFAVELSGQYAWDFLDRKTGMAGSVSLTDPAFVVSGTILAHTDEFTLEGRITEAATSVGVGYPSSLFDAIADRVNADVLPKIDSAQNAWNDLQEATGEYEFELSLRGVRTQIPGIVATARKALDDGIEAELKPHRGKVYYGTLESQVNSHAKPYYDSLNRLDTEARRTTDTGVSSGSATSCKGSRPCRRDSSTPWAEATARSATPGERTASTPSPQRG